MKKEKLMMMAAALFALAGCDNEETGNWAGEIRLGSNLAVQQVDTRAATGIQNDAFAIGENLDVYINEDVQKGQTPSTTYRSHWSTPRAAAVHCQPPRSPTSLPAATA